MKYTFRKFSLISSMYCNVKNDKYRKKELVGAVFYMLKHPSLFFVKKHIDCQHDSVLKNVNTIVNRPYFEEFYESL